MILRSLLIFNRWPDIFLRKPCSAFNLRSIFLVATIAFLLILFICMIYDLRYWEVPASLTIVPLFLAAIYALFHFRWILVVFVILLILISDLKIRKRRMVFAVVILAISSFLDPRSILELLSIFSFWSFWEVGAMGGADTKLIITTLLFTGNSLVVLPIVLVGGIQGLVAVIRKETSIPYLVALFCGTLIFTLVSKI